MSYSSLNDRFPDLHWFVLRCSGRIRHRAIKVVEAETGDGAVVDPADLQQLVALGLPTSFSSAQVGLPQ